MASLFPEGLTPRHSDSEPITLKKLLEAMLGVNSTNRALGGSATHAAAITPGASALSSPTKGIQCGETAGTITVNTVGGETGVVVPIGAYQTLPLEVTHVTAATATPLVALW